MSTMECDVYNVIQIFPQGANFPSGSKLKKSSNGRKSIHPSEKKDAKDRFIYPLTLKMIDTSEYLLYLQEQQALVCRGCKYCLQRDGVERHLQRNHLATQLEIRKELVSYAESLILREPSEVIIPITVIPAFDCLEIIQGFQCSICNSLYGTPRSIEKHCRTHRWMEAEGMNHN